MIEHVRAALVAAGFDVYMSGEVDSKARAPYLLLYSLQPRAERALSRSESGRRFRFGTTCVDLGSAHIEGDADRVEDVLEGSRAFHPLARIEMVSRGPLVRDPDVTTGGQEFHTLPIHWTATIPKEDA